MNFLPDAVAGAVSKAVFKSKVNSPTILFGLGIVGVVSSTVLACRATLKVDEVLEDGQRQLQKIRDAANVEGYEDDHQKRDMTIVYVQTTMKVARLYAPSVILGIGGIACLGGAHRILTQRNAALVAAYSAVERAFGEYRHRVVDKYGEQQDLEFRYGSEQVELVQKETGKKVKITRVASGDPSGYARFFDKTCSYWSKDADVNYMRVRNQQRYANELLKIRGHLFLNEVYDMFGMDRTQAGSIVGWRYYSEGQGDEYVDFGLFRDDAAVREFLTGREGSIMLDFNVDGVIYDKIDTPREAISWQRPLELE